MPFDRLIESLDKTQSIGSHLMSIHCFSFFPFALGLLVFPLLNPAVLFI